MTDERDSDSSNAAEPVWGAVLATILGIVQLVKHFRDKPRITVNAELSFRATDRETDIKGTLVETDHGPNEILLLVTAANRARQAPKGRPPFNNRFGGSAGFNVVANRRARSTLALGTG